MDVTAATPLQHTGSVFRARLNTDSKPAVTSPLQQTAFSAETGNAADGAAALTSQDALDINAILKSIAPELASSTNQTKTAASTTSTGTLSTEKLNTVFAMHLLDGILDSQDANSPFVGKVQSALTVGTSEKELVKIFFASDEYKAKNETEIQTAKRLYKTILGREVSDKEAQGWATELKNGKPLNEVIDTFFSSEEFNKNIKGIRTFFAKEAKEPTATKETKPTSNTNPLNINGLGGAANNSPDVSGALSQLSGLGDQVNFLKGVMSQLIQSGNGTSQQSSLLGDLTNGLTGLGFPTQNLAQTGLPGFSQAFGGAAPTTAGGASGIDPRIAALLGNQALQQGQQGQQFPGLTGLTAGLGNPALAATGGLPTQPNPALAQSMMQPDPSLAILKQLDASPLGNLGVTNNLLLGVLPSNQLNHFFTDGGTNLGQNTSSIFTSPTAATAGLQGVGAFGTPAPATGGLSPMASLGLGGFPAIGGSQGVPSLAPQSLVPGGTNFGINQQNPAALAAAATQGLPPELLQQLAGVL